MKTHLIQVNIDRTLLEKQLKFIGELIESGSSEKEKELLEGIWNLGHNILDLISEQEKLPESLESPGIIMGGGPDD